MDIDGEIGSGAGERSWLLLTAAGLALVAALALWLRRTGVIVPWGGK
jgi:LPXTG-motif cell wall-anchored protein